MYLKYYMNLSGIKELIDYKIARSGKLKKMCNFTVDRFNPLYAELNPICYLLALLGAHHILHVSGIRVNVGALF